MSRDFVARPRPRCPTCKKPPKWCLCGAAVEIACPLAIDVLMHYCEAFRPSSTGHLINRLFPDSRQFLAGGGRQIDRAAIQRPDRELWILHPQGKLPPAEARPEDTQILLIDGSWKQASDLLRSMPGWGRMVRLPMAGESRFHLRAQQGDHQFSTVEALLFMLEFFGLENARAQLDLQFELHVYAGLLARGKQAEARRYLEDSPVAQAYPEYIARWDPKWTATRTNSTGTAG